MGADNARYSDLCFLSFKSKTIVALSQGLSIEMNEWKAPGDHNHVFLLG